MLEVTLLLTKSAIIKCQKNIPQRKEDRQLGQFLYNGFLQIIHMHNDPPCKGGHRICLTLILNMHTVISYTSALQQRQQISVINMKKLISGVVLEISEQVLQEFRIMQWEEIYINTKNLDKSWKRMQSHPEIKVQELI